MHVVNRIAEKHQMCEVPMQEVDFSCDAVVGRVAHICGCGLQSESPYLY